MNVIFGSGVIGLLAKVILGDSWLVIPFHKSRLYSFNPALGDNFITMDSEIDQFIRELCGQKTVFPYKRAWSLGGQILTSPDDGICGDWLGKVFGGNEPSQCAIRYQKLVAFVYDIQVNKLYQSLANRYMAELMEEAKKGEITAIGDHSFIRDGVTHEFDRAISTIPLDVLCELRGIKLNLPAVDTHFLHIHSTSLDFEGNNQLLVVDPMLAFFKATNIAPDRYLLYFREEVQHPGVYLMSIIDDLDIIDGTTLERAIPAGPIPRLDAIEKHGIFCVGGYAQWDWCMDVGSCILRLLKYVNMGNNPPKTKEFISNL